MDSLTCNSLACTRGGFTLSVPSLRFTPGEKVALLGENGSGKSTLLHALCGLLPFSGQVTLHGKPFKTYTAEQRARHMAFLPQETGVLFNISVAELLSMALSPTHLLPAEEQDKAITATGMKNFLHKPVHTLSGGEMRRAMLSRVCCRNAPFLLLDEPTSSLDIRHSARFLEYLSSIPTCVVASMHDINLATHYFQRFILLRDGQIIADKHQQDLHEDDFTGLFGLPFHRLGTSFLPAL